MNEKGLYDLELCDFNELISKAKVSLKDKNVEYKKLLDEVKNIMESYPNLQLILEEDKEMNLTNFECKMLQKLFNLQLDIRQIEEQKIFFLGGREAYFYFKNIDVLKE